MTVKLDNPKFYRLYNGKDYVQIDLQLRAMLGDKQALVLSKIFGWLELIENSLEQGQYKEHVHDGKLWTWKSYKRWSKELRIGKKQFERAMFDLRDWGVIIIQQHIDGDMDNSSNWYTIDHEALTVMFALWEDKNQPIERCKAWEAFIEEWKQLRGFCILPRKTPQLLLNGFIFTEIAVKCGF